MAIHESQQNGEDFDLLKSSAKSITNGDCDGPISSHTTTPLPTDITSPTESSSSSSGNGNVNLTVNVPASSTVINAPQVMSPVVASNWLIESEKVKRDAKSKLNERLEGLRRSRKENESRASRWAKQLVEERQREIVASRLMLDQMREQRAVSIAFLALLGVMESVCVVAVGAQGTEPSGRRAATTSAAV